jgi:hypothetical protein
LGLNVKLELQGLLDQQVKRVLRVPMENRVILALQAKKGQLAQEELQVPQENLSMVQSTEDQSHIICMDEHA